MKRAFLTAALWGASAVIAHAGAEFTYVDLVRKLTDLEGLAVLPAPGEKCQQWSSYDRASRYDEQTGAYVDWGANNDCCGIIRTEGDDQVWAEMDGPGCVWRIWAAAAGSAQVRIYLDGAKEPTIDMPFSAYFDLKHEPFVYPSLVHDASNGQNCYLPIPYQKSCKIVADKTWGTGARSNTGEYYHIDYATYPKDTVVPTFKPDLGPEEKAALAAADKYLREKLGTDPAADRAGQRTETQKLTVPAGRTMTAARLEGKRAITAIRVKLDPNAPGDIAKTLREVVLQIRWDGEERPSVWTPLGDFFGTAPGINTHVSLPCGMSEDGRCYSLWYMPFAKGALVELVNDGQADFPLEMSITHAPLAKPIEQLGRFHAKWHRDIFLNTEPGREIDWPLLKTAGRGRYCGVMLSVWNPQGGWWGEGDEKFFVDGEKFPSFMGTGSEDYFGYAYCSPGLFQNAYHNQTISEGNRGCISVNRWQITENVPFQKSFEGDIEHYGFKPDSLTKYAATVCFYLAAGQADPYEANVPVADRTSYYKLRPVPHEPGAIEAERAKVLQITSGTAGVQRMYEWGDLWSGAAQIWWAWPKVGDRLVLAVPVASAGKYAIKGQLTKSADYAIVQLYLDDQKLGEPLDLYNPQVVPTGQLALGTMDLAAGEHRFTMEVIGKNQASAAYVVGIDYVKLEPAK